MGTNTKYEDLPNYPGVRARVERLDGHGRPLVVEREYLQFICAANGATVAAIVEADERLHAAVNNLGVNFGELLGGSWHAEVIMFHGCFVRVGMWCPVGTAERIGVRS